MVNPVAYKIVRDDFENQLANLSRSALEYLKPDERYIWFVSIEWNIKSEMATFDFITNKADLKKEEKLRIELYIRDEEPAKKISELIRNFVLNTEISLIQLNFMYDHSVNTHELQINTMAN